MICPECNEEKPKSDFLNNQKTCYKCAYRIRLQKVLKTQLKPVKNCRVCGIEISHVLSLRKRQRTVFCSLNCAAKGHREQMNTYLGKNIPTSDYFGEF